MDVIMSELFDMELNGYSGETSTFIAPDLQLQLEVKQKIGFEIGKEQARAEGKPEAMLEKIAQGKLGKFYKDSTLLNQEFVKDGSKTIAQMLDGIEKGLTVKAFKRIALG